MALLIPLVVYFVCMLIVLAIGAGAGFFLHWLCRPSTWGGRHFASIDRRRFVRRVLNFTGLLPN